MRRNDHARRAGTGRRADHCAEVPRIGDLIEAGEERRLLGRERPRVGVRIRAGPGNDALVVGALGRLGQLALLDDARSRPLSEPVERRGGPLGDPELEHLAPTAQRLTHGIPAEDELARHDSGHELEAVRHVADLPAGACDLVAQPIGLGEVAGRARRRRAPAASDVTSAGASTRIAELAEPEDGEPASQLDESARRGPSGAGSRGRPAC